MVAQTVERYGRLDILYHNAVDVKFVNEQDRRLTELPNETWHQMIDLVLTGTFFCAKYAGRQMIRQKSGSIILSSTVDALIGCAGLDSYTAAKGGVVSLTRSFAAGMARDGVRVNAICPGICDDGTAARMVRPTRSAGSDEYAASVAGGNSRAGGAIHALLSQRRIERSHRRNLSN